MPGFSLPGVVDGIVRAPYVLRALQKERTMRPISGFVVAALAVLALAGCSTTAANNNTTYARPPVSDGGVRVPLN